MTDDTVVSMRAVSRWAGSTTGLVAHGVRDGVVVVQEVVEVGVRDGVARQSPTELLVPALKKNVHAAGPVALAEGGEGAVHEVDEVLLRDRAAARLPRTIADDLGVDLPG